MSGWEVENNDSFGNGGFGSGGGGGSKFGNITAPFSDKRTEKNNKGGGFKPNVGFGGSSNTGSGSNPRPTSVKFSDFSQPKVKSFDHGDWARNLNKMIGVHNIPFFGQTQQFLGRTIWDWFKKPKAHFSDHIDRLNCFFVPLVLLFFVTVISANIFGAFGMEPMRCLRSAELNDEEREYALDYCQSKNTYYVAPEEGIPWANTERRSRQLGYYHWVPIMMFLQAILFMLPNRIWNGLNKRSGIEFVKFIEEANQLKTVPLAEPSRPDCVKVVAERIGEATLERIPVHRRMGGCRFGHSMGSYVAVLYVCIKIMYLANVVGQFFILNAFIGGHYRWWGYGVLKALLAGDNWQDSPVFPRLTLCDVPIRRLGDTPRYTLQCHLRINTYNEKIYLFIWWGFLLVGVLTFFNFIYYLIVLLFLPCTQENSIRHLLKQDRFKHIVYSGQKQHRKLIKRFANNALRKDGILLFWFIESHAGPIIAREIFGEIFDYYMTEIEHFEDDPDLEVNNNPKKGKGSFSSQSTGSVEDDDIEGGWNGGVTHRFGNGGVPISPGAPPLKFAPSGESTSFTSSQAPLAPEETSNLTNIYSSTPRKHNSRARPGHQQRYGADRRPTLLSRVFQRLGSALGSPHYANSSYYTQGSPIKNV